MPATTRNSKASRGSFAVVRVEPTRETRKADQCNERFRFRKGLKDGSFVVHPFVGAKAIHMSDCKNELKRLLSPSLQGVDQAEARNLG